MSGLTLLKIVAVAAFLGGIFLVIGSASSYLRNRKALETWPAADAVVTRSEVLSRGGASPRYQAEFDFRFTVDGNEHTGSLTASSRTFSREDSEKEARRFPVGSWHRIRYNPAQPGEIILDADPSDYFLTAAVPFTLGTVMALIGAVVLAVAFFKARAQ